MSDEIVRFLEVLRSLGGIEFLRVKGRELGFIFCLCCGCWGVFCAGFGIGCGFGIGWGFGGIVFVGIVRVSLCFLFLVCRMYIFVVLGCALHW